MKILILIASLLLVLAHSHKHFACVFDKLNRDLREQSKKAKPDISSVQPTRGRLLLTNVREQMRITMDASTFNTLIPGANGASDTTAENLAFILKTMQVATFFYMSRLQVYPLTIIMAPPKCADDYDTPPNDQDFGVSASDLHIYVTYVTDTAKSYGATGKSCKYYGDGTTPPPDSTLQIGRPTVGRIIFNTYSLVDTAKGLTNRLFQSVVSTALHETMHILGMDSTLYGTWLDSDPASARYTDVYLSTFSAAAGIISSSRPAATGGTMFLTTPNVRAWTRDFFNCPTAPGMLLENEDTTEAVGDGGGSHWERTAMYDELMTGTALGAVKYFSGLTFAVLRDMGWYTVDSKFNETSNFGYQKGCDFLYKACKDGTNFEEFCDSASLASKSLCQSSFYGKAICSSDSGLMADGCGLFGPYFNCVDPDSQNDGYQSYTSEVYGTNSFCVVSNLGSVALPSTVMSRCYPYVCGVSSVTFTVGGSSIVCKNTDTGVQKTISAFTGYLVCPDFSQFCTQARKTCPKWCSQNGYCMGGVCNCITGYYGEDCSQTTCTAGSYYNAQTSNCVTVCPSGYYQNTYNTACAKCAAACQQCYSEPSICTGCISTANNPQYFYNNLCSSVCPAGTFAQGFTCSACDAASFCATCNVIATNCTSCSAGKFLSQPVAGVCLVNCPTTGQFPVSDLVNHVCVASCADTLVLKNVGNNNNTCQYCNDITPNTYKFTSNSSCISSCPNRYYANKTIWLCAQCDASCLTCIGGSPEDCGSCSPTATLRYLHLKMCWSICPGGYYANDTACACQICPVELNCGNCTYKNTTMVVLCTSCAYSYFFQATSNSCQPACNSNQFANMGNNSCLNCDSACLTCAGPLKSQCTSCLLPALFISNVTGGFCISACPASGYFKSGGVTCLACDISCYKCSGTSPSQCTACFNYTYLSSGYCRMVCPPAKFPNDTANVCTDCDGSCTYCFGPTIDQCTACASGMVLYNFTCTLTCPKGYSVNQWNVCFEPAPRLLLALLLVALLFL